MKGCLTSFTYFASLRQMKQRCACRLTPQAGSGLGQTSAQSREQVTFPRECRELVEPPLLFAKVCNGRKSHWKQFRTCTRARGGDVMGRACCFSAGNTHSDFSIIQRKVTESVSIRVEANRRNRASSR